MLSRIVHADDRFEVSVRRVGGFWSGVTLKPLSGVRVVSLARLVGETASWRVLATGGPCELSLTARGPDDACFLSYPVSTEAASPPPAAPPMPPLSRGNPLAERDASDAPPEVTFVNTTQGLGVEVRQDGRVLFSQAPIVVLDGNCDGAPARLVRFTPNYAYRYRQRAHFYAEMLAMWRAHVECSLLPDGIHFALALTPRYETDIRRIALGEWLKGEWHVRKGEVLRVEHVWHVPNR